MKAFVKFAKQFLTLIYKLLFRYSEAVLLVIVALVTLQVFVRKINFLNVVLGGGFVWTEEVSLLLVVWMAFISMAIGVAEDLHISISIFYDRFPKWLKNISDYLNAVLIMGVGAVLMYYGILLVGVTRTSTLPVTKWPSFILYIIIPISGFYIVYFSLNKLYRMVRRLDDRKEPEVIET